MITADRRAFLIEAGAEAQPYPPERALAKAWLTENLNSYDDIDWQKRVGTGVDLGADYPDVIRKMAAQATRKRADLVAYNSRGVTIIELKDHVDLAAVRQALDYAELWKVAPADPPVVAVVVVGRTGDAGIADNAAQQGVTVELFPQVQV